jgi:hypothetical protein
MIPRQEKSRRVRREKRDPKDGNRPGFGFGHSSPNIRVHLPLPAKPVVIQQTARRSLAERNRPTRPTARPLNAPASAHDQTHSRRPTLTRITETQTHGRDPPRASDPPPPHVAHIHRRLRDRAPPHRARIRAIRPREESLGCAGLAPTRRVVRFFFFCLVCLSSNGVDRRRMIGKRAWHRWFTR